MKKKEIVELKTKYARALEALNRLLYSNGKKGVAIVEMDQLLIDYQVPKKDRYKLLALSALKYL